MIPNGIGTLGFDVERLRKDVNEAVALYKQVYDAIDKIENQKVRAGSLADVIAKNKQLVDTNQQLTVSYEALTKVTAATTKAQADNATATKANAQATGDSAKSFTQNTAAVEENIKKQQSLKKELQDIVQTRKTLNDFNSKTNFSNNPQAQVQIEQQLLNMSERELQIKKQLAELNTQLKGDNVGAGNFQGTDATDAAKAKAKEKEETRQLNAELKSQAQLELATVGSINEAKAAVSLLTKERDNLNLTTEEGVKRQNELNIKIDEYNAFIKENNDLQGKQRLNVGNYPSAFSGAFTTLKEELASVKQQLNDPGLQGKQLDSLKNQEALLTQLTENLGNQFNSTREELRAYQEASKQLGLTLGADSALFQDFADQVGGAKDEINDLQAAVNFNASDTKFLDGAIEGVNGLAGAYSAFTGVLALTGDEDEDLQKTMVKLQALIAITTGLQQVQTIVQGESATMQSILAAKTGLLALAQKLLGTNAAAATVAIEAEAAAQTEAVAATEAQVIANAEVAVSAEAVTVAVGEEAVATEAATAATVTLAEAFAATGIGAVILAVAAALVYAAVKLKEWISTARDAYDANVQLTASIKEESETIKKQTGLIDERNKANLTALQNESTLAEAAGQNREKQFEQQAKLLQQQKEIADERLGFEIAQAEKEYSEAGVKGLEALNLAQTGYLAKYSSYVQEISVYQKQLSNAVSNKDDDAKEEAEGRIADLTKEADATKAAYDRITGVVDSAAGATLSIQQQQLEQTKYNAEEERRLTLALTEFEVSNIKSRNEQILSDTESSFAKRRSAMESNASAEIKLAQAQLNDVLNNPTSSQNDRIIAEKNFQEKRIEVIRSSHTSIDKLNDEERSREITADKAMYDTRLKELQSFYTRASQDPNLSLAQQLASFDKVQQLQREQVIADHAADEKIKNQSFRTDQERAADESAFQQQLNDIAQKGADARLKFIEEDNKRLQQESLKSQEILKNAIQSLNLSDVDTTEQYAQDVTALDRSLAGKKISLTEYNHQRKHLDDDYNLYTLASQLAKDKKELAEVKHNLSEEFALREKIANEEIALAEKTAEKKKQLLAELADAERQFADEVLSLGQTIGDASFEKKINNYERLKQASDDYYSREIENIANANRIGSVTDEEAANRTTILNAEKAAAAERYDKQERALKVKQARFDKAASIARIIASTAEAIMKTYAEFGFPLGTPLAIAQGAIGAIQIATVLAQPIPTYKHGLKGGKGAHIGIYGEAGMELVEKPGIAPYIADKATVDYLPAHTKITPLNTTDINTAMNRAMYVQTAKLLQLEKQKEGNNNDKATKMLMAQNAHNTKQIVKAIGKNKASISIYDNSAYLKWKEGRINW